MNRQPLFEKRNWTMHTGGKAEYKIECDALTDEDIDCLAYLISTKGQFSKVHGVPKGGARLAKSLERYATSGGARLIVDDVLTTGSSMEQAKTELGWSDAIGIVIFARSKCPEWVLPMFQMSWINSKDIF